MPTHLRTPPVSIHLWALVIVALLLFTPAVSAEVLIDEGSNYATFDLESAAGTYAGTPHEIGIYNIQDWDGLYFVYVKVSGGGNAGILKANPSYSSAVTLKIGSDVVGSGTAHYNALFNSAGDVAGVQIWLEIDSWHPTGYIGTQTVTIHSDSTLFNGIILSGSGSYPAFLRVSPERPIGIRSSFENSLVKGTHIARSHYHWENVIDINDEFVSLTRNLDGNTYTSTLQITSDSGYFVDTSPNDIDVPYIGSGTWNVTNPNGRIYSGILGSDAPGTPTNPIVTVYVRNSQTGALLAGAHILIEGTPGVDNWTEYVNTTLPSGTGSYSLPGMPYQFRILAESPGYTSTGYQYFRAGDTVIVDMEPYIDAPTNESNTFLEFYIRDLNANPLGGATVAVDGQWLYSNNNGYARFEVSKNATYPYTVRKSGYMTISGTATVADGPRYVVNVVLGPGTVPTNPPATDPGGPGATPTPDRRTNEEKGQAVIDMIADNAEGIGALALICLLMGLLKLMVKW
ncbi:MAG TPA: hypothetical protein GX735_04710 [Firmicutes bacterium]|nr:hypothetical protein [Bacillota bacterium]